jgi:hypothetical protein
MDGWMDGNVDGWMDGWMKAIFLAPRENKFLSALCPSILTLITSLPKNQIFVSFTAAPVPSIGPSTDWGLGDHLKEQINSCTVGAPSLATYALNLFSHLQPVSAALSIRHDDNIYSSPWTHTDCVSYQF